MCPCNPLDEANFNAGPPPPGFNVGSISLPSLNIPFPDLPLDDLMDLFNKLGMILPSGLVKPHLDTDVLNSVMHGIMSLLNTFMPFLMLYKFFLPILNLILCILEVICSIPHPVKIIRALRRLFRVCLPEFLSLFPAFALILMIIALILLIIALIEYLIARILQIIETILRNILILSKAAKALNSDSIIAIVKKIGDLLCVLQNLFILFAVFNTIFQIIKAMTDLSFKIPPCDSSDGSDDGCCTPDVCPQFLKDNETITSSDGYFQYLNAVGIDSGLSLPVGFAPFFSTLRSESWQFYDPSLGQDKEFINITHAWDLPAGNDTIFFPEGTNYTKNTGYKGVPYYISFKVNYDPVAFDRNPITDNYGVARVVRIVNAIVQNPPTDGYYGYNNNIFPPNNGTLNLIGGIVANDAENSPVLNPDLSIATITDFFHKATTPSATLPASDDSIHFSNIDYVFTINHPVLMGAGLITAGCVPSVALERDWLAATIGQQFNDGGDKLKGIVIPDMGLAQQSVADAITDYRKLISTDTTNKFKDNVIGILNDLRDQSATTLRQAIDAGYDPYKSDFSVDPTIQFTTKSIKLKVLLNESSGNSITTNLPPDVGASLALNLSVITTFGELSNFIYDGSLYFTSEITNLEAGNGTIQVAYNNRFISTLTNQSDLNLTPSIVVKTVDYTFVKSQVIGDSVRRDDTDISGGV